MKHFAASILLMSCGCAQSLTALGMDAERALAVQDTAGQITQGAGEIAQGLGGLAAGTPYGVPLVIAGAILLGIAKILKGSKK